MENKAGFRVAPVGDAVEQRPTTGKHGSMQPCPYMVMSLYARMEVQLQVSLVVFYSLLSLFAELKFVARFWGISGGWGMWGVGLE